MRLLVLQTLVLLAACAEAPERPALASDSCNRRPCVERLPPGLNAGSASRPPAPTADAATANAAPDSVLLWGEVRVATSADLANTVPVADATLELTAFGPDGSISSTSVTPGRQFSLPVEGLPVRISVRQVSGAEDLVDTLQRVDDDVGPVELLVLDRTVLLDVATNLVLTPTTLNSSAGHAFVRITDASGGPLSEVRLGVSEGVVAYDLGVFFTDATESTAERGTAVLLNLPAVAAPGGTLAVQLERLGQTRIERLFVARNSVSLIDVVW